MSETHKPSIDEIRAQAIENARIARESIGEDVLAKAVAMIQQNQKRQDSSALQQARAQIDSHDLDDLTRELRYLIES